MIYSFEITTPANTLESDKKITRLKLTEGILQQIDIVFPVGCATLAYIAFYEGGHQVFPTNPDESFHSDDDRISFKEALRIEREPYEFVARTYNLDTIYSHTIIVRLGILRRDDILGLWVPWAVEEIK